MFLYEPSGCEFESSCSHLQILVISKLNGRKDFILRGFACVIIRPIRNYLFRVRKWIRCENCSRLKNEHTTHQTFVGLEDVSKTSLKRLQRNNFSSSKMSWIRLANTSWRRFEDQKCYAEDVLKTSWKTRNVCWVITLNSRVSTFKNFKSANFKN